MLLELVGPMTCQPASQPANQPIHQPTNQPTSQPLAGLGWLGWPIICAKTNKTKVNQATPSQSTLKTKKT